MADVADPGRAAPDGGTERTGSPGYRALRTGAAAGPIRRDVVTATGPEAALFLQGQLSADVAALAAGASTWSWVLQPTGKVAVLARVSRLDGDRFVLDTDPGWGDTLAARLRRFKLRSKLDLEQPDWGAVALRGPGARPPAPSADAPVVADASWPGLVGYDLLGPSPSAPPGLTALAEADLEIARIEVGIVRMGAELDDRTIPAETGLVERTVSFTKGCYTGQELVARIDSRGSNVARRLCGLRLDGPALDPAQGVGVPDPIAALAGAALHAGGKEVGTLTSVARSPSLGPIALGYLRRAVALGDRVEVLIADGTPIVASVSALPLLP